MDYLLLDTLYDNKKPLKWINKSDNHFRIRVKLGDAKRSDPAQEIDVSKVIPHEKYEPSPKFTNDIALLKLSREYKSGGIVFFSVFTPVPLFYLT